MSDPYETGEQPCERFEPGEAGNGHLVGGDARRGEGSGVGGHLEEAHKGNVKVPRSRRQVGKGERRALGAHGKARVGLHDDQDVCAACRLAI